MKKHTLGLSIATILLLAACGGGGSDDNSPADPNNGGSNNNTPSVPKISSPAAPTNKVSGTYQGKAYIIPVNGGTGKAENIGGNNIATPTISGQQIATEIPNISGGGMTFISNSNIFGKSYRFFVASGRNELPNSRFGYINEGDKDYIFSHGTLTTNMPTSGTAKYSGEAVLGRSASGTLGTANITADFGQKTLAGSITRSKDSDINFNQIDLNATISGNSFSGDGAVKSNGNFYGNNAAEVGGIFHDTTQNLYGSFGAKRASN